MLPPQVAEKLGLGLHETSPALSYTFEFEDLPDNENPGAFKLKSFSIELTTLRVTRLTYAEADKKMDREPFLSMKKITDAFREKRRAAGAVSINMPEVKIRVEKHDGESEIHITPLPELASREMVSESMLMAGHYAALWCRERNIPIPYAVQETSTDTDEPDTPEPPVGPEEPATLEPENTDNSGNSGYPVEPGDESISPSSFHVDYAAQFSLRRGMKRSRTTLECGVHGGLGLDAYTRVTSPLRRYPDLITSRQIRNTLLGKPIQDKESVLTALAAYESRAGSLVQAERRSNLFWKLQWLKKRPNWTAQAVLVDRRERQGFFLIPEIALETRVAMKKDVKPGGRAILKLKEVDIPESSVLFVIQEVLE